VSHKRETLLRGAFFGLSEYRKEPLLGCLLLAFNLVDRLSKPGDFFNAYHVEFGLSFEREINRHAQRSDRAC
jgi:hypothetical protein